MTSTTITLISIIWFLGCLFIFLVGNFVSRREAVMAAFWPITVLVFSVRWILQGLYWLLKNLILGSLEAVGFKLK